VLPDNMLLENQEQIVALAAKQKPFDGASDEKASSLN
jgi:hypothetical protein